MDQSAWMSNFSSQRNGIFTDDGLVGDYQRAFAPFTLSKLIRS
jgi:hypothetical protein